MKYISIAFMAVLSFGCATVKVDKVSTPISKSRAIAEINNFSFKPGDRLQVIKEECRLVDGKNFTKRRCSETPVGTASILEMRSSNQVVIQAENDIELETGMVLQQAK